MCGRIAQYRSKQQYAHEVGWDEYARSLTFSGPSERYNVPPGSSPYLLHALDGKAHIEAVHWGYHTAWAKEKKIPMAVNATIEKARSPYWRALWKTGRAIVPADGWYEWTGEKGSKQPWFIRHREDRPIFLAAVTNFKPGSAEAIYGTGFAIVTADATGGLVDVHDRRPVVLSAEDAKLWMDLDWSAEQAEQIARETALPPEAFEWYQVGKEVNKADHNGPELIEPLKVD